MALRNKTIAVIGAGNMGEALVRGLLSTRTITPQQIVVADIHPGRREVFVRTFGVRAIDDNAAAVTGADVVVIAVKPQQIREAAASFREAMTPDKLVVTIAAGIPTARLERELGDHTRVVRVMPNMPAQIGVGAAALAKGRHATDEDLVVAEAILNAVGITVRTEEWLLDAVTALSGTGPAYVFLLAEMMTRAGMEMGMGEALTKELTVQTILGAAMLLAQSGEEPLVLRQRVTSKGGTTEAAMRVIHNGHMPDLFVEAVKAAERRSRELSES